MRLTLHLARAACLIFLHVAAPGWSGAPGAQDHQYSSQDIEAGSRVYSAQCALCHGVNGDTVNGIDLRRGRFRRSISDEDIAGVIAAGVPAAGMPGFSLKPAEVTAVLAFIRAGFDPSGIAVKVGNVARGQALYGGKGKCGTCHRINGAGPRVAPDLSDVGAARTPAALQRSLLDPTAAMWPINRPVHIVTKDGREIRGRRLNEDTYTVQLIDESERLVSVAKTDLRTFELGKTSPMPSVAKTFTPDEVADMVAYLLSLKGLP
jgi:putative heme-binding domain-containing protein